MSFTFIPNLPFEWPVTICTPKDGSFEEQTFNGLFELRDDSEFATSDSGISTVSEAIEEDIKRLMDVFKGWKEGEIVDANNKPIPATPEMIRAFLSTRPNRIAVTEAYFDANNPKDGHRAKN